MKAETYPEKEIKIHLTEDELKAAVHEYVLKNIHIRLPNVNDQRLFKSILRSEIRLSFTQIDRETAVCVLTGKLQTKHDKAKLKFLESLKGIIRLGPVDKLLKMYFGKFLSNIYLSGNELVIYNSKTYSWSNPNNKAIDVDDFLSKLTAHNVIAGGMVHDDEYWRSHTVQYVLDLVYPNDIRFELAKQKHNRNLDYLFEEDEEE